MRSLRKNSPPRKRIEVSTASCYKKKKIEKALDLYFPTTVQRVDSTTINLGKGFYDPFSGESPPGGDLEDSPQKLVD